MAVNLHIPSETDIFPVAGVEIGVTEAGIKKENRKDLTVFKFSPGTAVAGVFTKNRFRAAPVQICESRLQAGHDIRALLINTGNANAGSGADGLDRAYATCHALAKELGVLEEQILPFSTGVILEPLPSDKIIAALPKAINALGKNEWMKAAYGIMTTDTLPKICSRQIQIEGRTVTFTGISKGAGMIRPNMATMLGFLATDADIEPELLKSLTLEIANRSFNRITVDGDTSTNDSFIVAATGQSGIQVNDTSSTHYEIIASTLSDMACELAQKIVRDAEGATKFITIRIEDASDSEEALKVAYAIAHSPLVKTAFYASDPNLGRILAAVGYAGIEDLDVSKTRLWLGDVLVAENGGRSPAYQEEDGKRVMTEAEILVRISLGRGNITETVYTCDFSHDYVSINADYRS
ncbi:MAG: bifunctional glutamate N-acetyltransferase/amino-acid acetyltransferase ArgJ [Alcaligenaceae bacterium]|nr:bifunctional glutamate N-acetyltransferase/amino-acid acetyltransferase ArgJ [Alcaligenaceae bacterium]